MRSDPADLPPAEFKKYLEQRRDELIHFNRPPPGKNNRSYTPHKKGQLFFSSGVKIAMQRRRTK